MNKMKKFGFAVVLLLILLCFAPIGNAKAATKAQISVKVPTEYAQAKPGDVIEVGVYIKLTDFTANNLQFYINFDNTKLSVKRESGGAIGTLIYQQLPDDDNYPDDYIAEDWDVAIEGSAIKIMWANGNYTPDIAPGKEIHFMNLRFTVKSDITDCTTSVSIDKTDINISYVISETQTTELKSSEIAVSSATINITNTVSTDATLKSLVTSDGTLSPAFSSGTTDYTMTVPYTTTKVSFTATANHAKASCKISGGDNLAVGNNTVNITVTAESGNTKTYTVTVTRTAAATDNTLKSLKVNGTTVSGFSATKYEYTVTLPYETDKVSISAEKNNAYATITGDYSVTNAAISAGESKTFTITVTAQDGSTKTYKVTVTRAKCSVNTLSGIKPSTGSLSPAFSSGTLNYTMSIPYTVKTLKFTATATHTTASIAYEGDGQEINFGSATKAVTKTVKIVVTAQDGSKNTYTVTVTREAAATDDTLKSLKVNGTTVSGFSATKYEYTVTLPYETDKVSISAEKNNAYATITGDYSLTNVAISAGESKTFTITVTAQDGSTKTYKVTVTRAKCSVNTLSGIKPSTGNLSPAFSSGTLNYTMSVPYTVKTLKFTATATHTTASIAYEGDGQEINFGTDTKAVTKTVKIVVTAQDGSQKTYTVTVTRAAADTDNTLKSLTDSQNNIKFDKNKQNYSFTVDYSVSKITITGTADSSLATVSGNVKYKALNVGENKFEIVVTAQDGNKKTYTVVVTRTAAATDNNLLSLKTDKGEFDKTFSSNVTDYYMTVPYNTQSLTFTFVLSDDKASVNKQSPYTVNLVAGKVNDVQITVTAQSGAKKTYTVHVTRVAPVTDSTLKNLSPLEGEFTEAFDPLKTEYSMTVSTKVKTMEFKYALSDSSSTVLFEGDKNLKLGNNEFKFTVTAEDGSKTVYIVNVLQVELSSDATLKSLTVNNIEIDFSPDVKKYKVLLIVGTQNVNINFETSHEKATAILQGDTNLDPDSENVFNVVVTAQDGTVQNYEITVGFREKDTDSTLKDLKDSLGKLVFDSNITEYDINVPYNTDEITFEYVCNSPFAIVQIAAPEKLVLGTVNVYTVTVIAEDGTQTVYTVNVTKDMMADDSKLEMLKPSWGEFTTDFVPENTDYELNIPNSITEVDFEYILKSADSQVLINYPETLLVGENTVTFTVTAPNGEYTVYTVVITRKEISSDSSLSSIKINGEELPEFDALIFDYALTIPNSVKNIAVDYITAYIAASAELTIYPDELSVGDNLYVITVTAEDGSTSKYSIIITRLDVDSDSTLSNITVNGKEIGFELSKTEYDIEFGNDVDIAEIEFVLSSKYAKAELIGSKNLIAGVTSKFVIKVTADDLSVTEYTINILRKALSSDSTASEIVIGGVKIDVLATNKEHKITLPYATDIVEVTAKASSSVATVEITGDVNLKVGTNVFTVKITAEDGTNTVYTINVERDGGSSDASLKDIVPLVGKLNENFSSGLFGYTMSVEKNVESISFDIKTSHELATYVVSDTNLKIGTNRITVTVTSENGATLTYYVDVTREGDSLWKKLCNTTVFSIGNLSVSVVVFGIAALLIIIACVVILVIIVNKSKVKRIKHR